VWEAQALLRARVVAGDADLGARFIAAIDPVRYPDDGLDSIRTREIRRIKARVDNERLPRGADPSTHTKLGRGGLADVEWTLQLLQLQHAARVPALRTTSTLDGLAAAVDAGLIDPVDADALREAWLLPPGCATPRPWFAANRATRCPPPAASWPPWPACWAAPWTPTPASFWTPIAHDAPRQGRGRAGVLPGLIRLPGNLMR